VLALIHLKQLDEQAVSRKIGGPGQKREKMEQTIRATVGEGITSYWRKTP